MQFNSNQFNLPEVTKNLVIINVLVFIGTYVAESQGTDISQLLAMHYPGSSNFRPWQLLSHMFMHGGLMHLAFNMFALWMFGARIEQSIGAKRFLQLYFFSAIGAFFIHFGIMYIESQYILSQSEPGTLQQILTEGKALIMKNRTYSNENLAKLNKIYNGSSIVGASGAISGVLAAFAMFWPNTELYLMFIPVPIKAKNMLIGTAIISLILGFVDLIPFLSNIAHHAHLGGILFGFLIIKYWNKTNRKTLY